MQIFLIKNYMLRKLYKLEIQRDKSSSYQRGVICRKINRLKAKINLI